MHPTNPQQQRDEQLKREESRKEEQEKNRIESLLRDFDSLAFYENLERWEKSPIPQPVRHRVQVTTLRQKDVYNQPLPITRKDLSDLRRLSTESARLLYILRAVDQRGMECPYIHQQNKQLLERSLEKCVKLKEAGAKYLESTGLWARLSKFLNKFHLDVAERDLESFQKKLEAVLLMCRHQEFAQDLMKLRSVAFDRSVQSMNVLPTTQLKPQDKQALPSQQPGAFRTGTPIR